jgi:hypothetical protein
MAFNVTDLQTALANSQLSTKTNAIDAQNEFALELSSFITSNYKLNGTYSGTIAGPSPDPLNGTYKWANPSITISGTNLYNEAHNPTDIPTHLISLDRNVYPNSYNSWITQLAVEISLTEFLGKDITNKITIGSVKSVITLPIVTLPFTPTTSTAIYTTIINAMKAATHIPVAATSISPGSGTVTITSFGD